MGKLHQPVEVIDTLKENLYTVPSVQDWSDAGIPNFGSGTIRTERKLKMADESGILKGGEPTTKKKAKKKAASKKAAPKKATKKKAAKKK